MSTDKEWFEHWFDTSYYHLLYDHRNDQEAAIFMSNMLKYLQLNKGDRVLDLPCGKGRHAVFLHSQGLEVVGADISKNSILEASERYARKGLSFEIHDMRTPLQGRYHAIFNLFTSFGYFPSLDESLEVLKNFKIGLKQGGRLIIDFLNVDYVAKQLVPVQIVEKNDVRFEIQRSILDGFVLKDIVVYSKEQKLHFRERVQALDLTQFKQMIKEAGFHLEKVFGSYDLAPFDQESSERLILVLS